MGRNKDPLAWPTFNCVICARPFSVRRSQVKRRATASSRYASALPLYCSRQCWFARLGAMPTAPCAVCKSNVRLTDRQRWSIRSRQARVFCDACRPPSGAAKLTAQQVVRVREMREQGITMRKIADSYGVTAPTIYAIVTRKTWATVQ
jgi:hypothetical protein